MRFYPVDPYTEQVLHDEDAIGKVRVEIDWDKTGEYEEIPEADIEEAFFESAEREDGGTTAEGSLLLSNESGRYDLSGAAGVRRHAESPVRVSFSAGKDASFFHRFSLFIHEDGIQEILGPGKAKRVRIPLADLSARLRNVRAGKPFGEAAYIHWNYVSLVPTATWPESVLSILCAIGGLAFSDLSCLTIQLGLPFVKLTGSVWDELCTLARAYRALRLRRRKPADYRALVPLQDGGSLLPLRFDHLRPLLQHRQSGLRHPHRIRSGARMAFQ